MPKPNNTIESLLAKVDKQANGCWVWTGRVNHKGYGRASWQGKDTRVHRIFYEHFRGPVAEGLQVCHHCDNPPCCNPDHLFSGTAMDNEWDKIAKGRRKSPYSSGYRSKKLVAGLGFEPRTSGL